MVYENEQRRGHCMYLISYNSVIKRFPILMRLQRLIFRFTYYPLGTLVAMYVVNQINGQRKINAQLL